MYFVNFVNLSGDPGITRSMSRDDAENFAEYLYVQGFPYSGVFSDAAPEVPLTEFEN